jgi:hypothetical protein
MHNETAHYQVEMSDSIMSRPVRSKRSNTLVGHFKLRDLWYFEALPGVIFDDLDLKEITELLTRFNKYIRDTTPCPR